MTMIATVLIGVSVLLIASGLDGSSLKDTFTKIINNLPVDWTGTANTSDVHIIGTTPGNLPLTVSASRSKTCPPGYTYNATRGLCDLNNPQKTF